MYTAIGELESVSYNPEEESIMLVGEYGNYQVITDDRTRQMILDAIESIEEDG